MSKTQTFEEKLTALKASIEHLEQGQTPIDQAMTDYKTAQTLLKACRKDLENIETEVSKIINPDGAVEPFEPS